MTANSIGDPPLHFLPGSLYSIYGLPVVSDPSLALHMVAPEDRRRAERDFLTGAIEDAKRKIAKHKKRLKRHKRELRALEGIGDVTVIGETAADLTEMWARLDAQQYKTEASK